MGMLSFMVSKLLTYWDARVIVCGPPAGPKGLVRLVSGSDHAGNGAGLMHFA